MWYKGNIYDTDGKTYAGLVKYDLENNVVQLQTENLSTFTASNVSHFEIHNKSDDGIRSFYSLPYSQNGDNETLVFFEVLSEGNDVVLLSREYILTYYKDLGTKGVIGMNPRNGPKTFTGYRLAFNFYFFRNGIIEPYSLRSKDLYTMLPGHDEEIKRFMRQNGLDHDKRGDLIKITAYYNDLQN